MIKKMLIICHYGYAKLEDLIRESVDLVIITDFYDPDLYKNLKASGWEGRMMYEPGFLSMIHGTPSENHSVMFVTSKLFLLTQFNLDPGHSYLKWHSGDIYLVDFDFHDEMSGASSDTLSSSHKLGNKRYAIPSSA